MTDKEKILAEIERQIELNNNIDPVTTAQQLVVDSVNVVLTDLLDFIESLKEESVSKDLELAATKYAQDKYMPVQTSQAFKAGAKWQKENLWKPADGDDLPEYEREVVVFTQNFPNDAGMMMVAIGHRPTPEGFDGKSLTTGKVEYYTPKTYDKGGWNIPDTRYWLDVELPKETEEL